MKIWGIPLFFTGLILIAIGILPYRRLTRIQLKPHEFHYDGQSLHYYEQGKPQLRIPQNSIESLSYVEKDELYGLLIKLKRPFQEKIAILNNRFDLESFLTKSAEKFPEGDLFLPYFSERSFKEAASWLQ
ncbi:MAG: hypothetical protein K940chlam9_01237 [Chlamydiae bacterium]|nr:hypothetical protein [Chlamydiota bacterium]